MALRSTGHICFTAKFEYFERGGDVYRAKIEYPIQPDGYRFGRWEGSLSWFNTWRETMGA